MSPITIIIGLLLMAAAAVIMLDYSGDVGVEGQISASATTIQNQMRQIKENLNQYRFDNGGSYPSSISDLAPDYLTTIPSPGGVYPSTNTNSPSYYIDGVDVDADTGTAGKQPSIAKGAILFRIGTGANATEPAVTKEICDKIQQNATGDKNAAALSASTTFGFDSTATNYTANGITQAFGCWEDSAGNYTVFMR
jgi:type II secretory pathway pseudopilin PulG